MSTSRGPFGYDIPPDPLISDDVALSSLSFLVAATCACLATIVVLLKRLLKQGRRRYISSDSSIQLMIVRLYAILFAGCLLLGDIVNNLCHVWWLWTLRTSAFFWYRIAYVITYPPVVAIGTYAVAQRCAMIVVRDSTWRKRFLSCTMILCVTVIVIGGTAAVTLAFELRARTTNPLDWTDTLLTPLWTFPIYGLLPIVTIVGALASLRASLQQDSCKSSASSSVNTTGAEAPADSGAVQDPQLAHGVAATLSDKTHPQQPLGTTKQAITSSGRAMTAGKPRASRFVRLPPRPSISLGGTSPHAGAPDLDARRLEANRPLASSFRWLTGIIFVLWVLGFAFTLLKPWHPVLTSAINSGLTVAALITEASFERVLRINNQRLRPKTIAVYGVTTAGVGGESMCVPSGAKTQVIRGTALVTEES